MRFLLGRVLVEGPSMAPTLRHGDQVAVWWSTRSSPRPGAVVLAELPGERGLGIKRVAAPPADGRVWLVGDNPHGSTDSRHFGAVPVGCVKARVLVRLWPRPGRIRRAQAPNGPSAA